MSNERELKLLPLREINRNQLLRVLSDNGYKIEGEIRRQKQEDTYYDTPDKELYNNNRSLRIRNVEGKTYITYKVPTSSVQAYTERKEFEVEIPEEYISQNGKVELPDAINFLRQKYPDLELPENLDVAAKVNNNRNKINIIGEDGSKIEVAFDDVKAQDENGDHFKMKEEIEFELISGAPERLREIYETIIHNFDVQKNTLSKYSRAIKEMIEQKQNMSLEELTICAMLSDIIGTNEFEQLKHKGQIIHDYRVDLPPNLDLTNFKDPQYLMRKISAIKRIENYNPGKIKTLEDMFLCFFSDMDYQEIEYKLINFLNENYYREDQAITNRMSHSEQVMLITGLISRSKEIPEKDKNTLLCMASGLVHDIGHVPGAHPAEALLGSLDGFFSHEINGREVIERIISSDEDKITEAIATYAKSIGKEYDPERIKRAILENKRKIKRSIEEHSRTNSESRGEGTVVQLPREADKICYGVSDIVDILKRTARTKVDLPIGFFSKKWKDETTAKLGKGYEREEVIRRRIEEFDKLIRKENFGELITNIANTVKENQNDGKIYYDVEQDTWDILNEMIGYVKGLRTKGVIDVKKKEMQNASTVFIVKKFNEALARHPDNIEEAWEEALRVITNSNDIDMLNTVSSIYQQFKDKPEEFQQAFQRGGILDTTDILSLDNADRQIKLKPGDVFVLSDMIPFFGENFRAVMPDRMRDTYFNSDNGISICIRQYLDKKKQELIVKRKRDKRSNAGRKRKICDYRLYRQIITRINRTV